MNREYDKKKGKWHAMCIVDDKPFYPYPQSSFKIMKDIAEINGGGYVWHRKFPQICFRVIIK